MFLSETEHVYIFFFTFYTGTNNLQKQSLTSHANSRQQLVCVTAKRVVDNPSSGPLTMLVRNFTRVLPSG